MGIYEIANGNYMKTGKWKTLLIITFELLFDYEIAVCYKHCWNIININLTYKSNEDLI